MSDLVAIKRALISVSDKTGVVELARELARHGVEIISTGGTAKALTEAGVAVTPIEKVTGFPEMMDGRVKTLHPRIHGGLLAVRGNETHQGAAREHGIGMIDLVCVNLYPFEATIAKAGVTREEAIENIDIGGPSMIRSAAKNHEAVAVVTDASQYADVMRELKENGGRTTLKLRQSLAVAAFHRTGRYDQAIAAYLGEAMVQAAEEATALRYGENPHQAAKVIAAKEYDGTSIPRAKVLHGKELSYNNLNDAAAALNLAMDLHRLDPARAAAVVVKHTNPCGAAMSVSAADAVKLALDGDRLAAYGGILVSSRPIDADAVAHLVTQDVFLEVIVAPAFEYGALERLKARSANVRLLAVGEFRAPKSTPWVSRSIPGGMLSQEMDTAIADVGAWSHRAGPKPSAERLRAAAVVWTVCKHLTSNAIAIGGECSGGVRLFGAGAGQMDRVNSCRIAVEKAGVHARGAVAASDAFFPFADGPKVLIDAGVSMLVHTGGSKRDQETFDVCNERAVTCMTTGVRHFRH